MPDDNLNEVAVALGNYWDQKSNAEFTVTIHDDTIYLQSLLVGY